MGGGEQYSRLSGHIDIQVEGSDCPADATLRVGFPADT
jgi:hypothetical protein